jgi:hypothetical protein
MLFLRTSIVREAGVFSGRHESHRGKSQNPVAWIAFMEETKWVESIDKAILGMVSECVSGKAGMVSGR